MRLAQNDGQSVLLWVDQLHKDGDLLTFKSSADAVLKNSGLDEDAFALAMQTLIKRRFLRSMGMHLLGWTPHTTPHTVWAQAFSL